MTTVTPVKGTATWLTNHPNGCRRLEIVTDTGNGTVLRVYEVEPVMTGYVLYGTRDTYRVDVNWADGWACTCKDAQYRRPGCCKHVRGLRAALAKRPY